MDKQKVLEKLLDAHLKHERARFIGRGLKKSVVEDADAVFEWAGKVRLKDIATPEQVLGVIRRQVVECPLPPMVTELAVDMSRTVLASRHNDKATLQDIFARRQFDEIVGKTAGLKDVRDRILHAAVHTPAYAGLISGVVYTLMREFLQKEMLFTRKMPGVSSLMKLGKEAMNKAMPGLEATAENRIREFIRANLGKALQLSERFLVGFLSEERMAEIANRVWDSIAHVPLSQYLQPIDAADMEDLISVGAEFWLRFRETPYFEQICTEVTQAFFEHYGEKTAAEILDDLGVSRRMVVGEVLEILKPAIDKALATGYLEQRVRARLEAFYLSSKTASLLKS